MVEEGERGLREGEAGLDRILGKVHEMDAIGDNILTEMDRQINELDKIYDEMSDT